jgi:hypothetical protein
MSRKQSENTSPGPARPGAGLTPDEAAREERLRALTSETMMMSPIQTVRSVRGDPLYRAEALQAPIPVPPALAVLLAPLVGAAAVLLAAVLPALWAAESILREREGGTLESLLLTPVDRQRIMWAKLLARLRPLWLMTLCCPVTGAILGAVHAADCFGGGPGLAGHVMFEGCTGLVLGSLLGVELLAFGFTAGTAGLLAAVKPGGRITVMLRALFYEAIVLVPNCVLLALALAPGLVCVGAPITAILLPWKWLAFNWLRGARLLDRSADLMDRLLLAGGSDR